MAERARHYISAQVNARKASSNTPSSSVNVNDDPIAANLRGRLIVA
jgi:hypothetical protein